MNKKNTLIYSSIVLFSSFFFSACSFFPGSLQSNITPTPESQLNITTPTSNTSISPSGAPTGNTNQTVVGINTKYGQIVIELDQKNAPKTVANFIKKINSGFYNNLTFHRVEPGFVVQGGDPLGNGTGGGTISSEINNIPFERGSLGLARGGNRDISNDSQFFICLSTDTCSQLTGEYVNFGKVVSGMDSVDKIQIGDKILTATTKTK